MPHYAGLIYDKQDRVAWITINRPERHNTFTQSTYYEFAHALARAADDPGAGVVVISGAGGKAFSTGGDVKQRTAGADDTFVAPGLNILRLVRSMPKAVIAMVDGYAVGFGNVLAFNCDLTICSERSTFAQPETRVGSYYLGWATTYLARVVGPKKAREIWFLGRRYSALEALQMRLVNRVVPHEELRPAVEGVCREILAKSPTAIATIKASFNPDVEHIDGVRAMGQWSLELYYRTDEAQEGGRAFSEKRQPDFGRYQPPKILPQG